MGFFDIVVIVVVLLSFLVGLLRGFVREALSLIIWVAAFLTAMNFADDFSLQIPVAQDTPQLRWLLAAGALFLLVIVIGNIIKYFFDQLIKVARLTSANRVAGGAFGVFRGLVILSVLMVAVQMMTQEPLDTQTGFLQNSLFAPYLLDFTEWLQPMLPVAQSVLPIPQAMHLLDG